MSFHGKEYHILSFALMFSCTYNGLGYIFNNISLIFDKFSLPYIHKVNYKKESQIKIINTWKKYSKKIFVFLINYLKTIYYLSKYLKQRFYIIFLYVSCIERFVFLHEQYSGQLRSFYTTPMNETSANGYKHTVKIKYFSCLKLL